MTRGMAARRVVVAVTLLAFLVACTSSIPVPKTEAIEQKEFYRHKVRLKLTNGEELVTKRMVVTDSTATLYSVSFEGKMVDRDPPLVIPLNEVERIERVQRDNARTWGGVMFLSALTLVVVWVGSQMGRVDY